MTMPDTDNHTDTDPDNDLRDGADEHVDPDAPAAGVVDDDNPGPPEPSEPA